jgi:hypothetical protein
VLSVPQFQDNILVAGVVCGMFCGFKMEWFCIGLGSVKFGSGCRHFRDSRAIFLERYGNFCSSISKLGRSMVINEYIYFYILSNGLVICGFFRWNFYNVCGSIGSGVRLLVHLFIRIVVHCVEFSLIN